MPVHPRIRGERTGAARGNVIGGGSSPHTRGTPRLRGLMLDYVRFIPAYAGNASTHSLDSGGKPVHPRIRGERLMGPITEPPGLGSSPHTRGTRQLDLVDAVVTRFIPAYAGNARGFRAPGRSCPVHPRIRGERFGIARAARRQVGSSPHTRGTPVILNLHQCSGRFIPAYAGNALSSAVWAADCLGSSPHTRGTPHRPPCA